MPASSLAVERFARLHEVAAAVVRLFAAGDWTPERGRSIEAGLRALLLARTAEGDDDACGAVLEALAAADLFDPAVIADRGPFLERLLALRDGALLDAAGLPRDAQPPGWSYTPAGHDTSMPAPAASSPACAAWPTADGSSSEQRFTGLLTRALTRLYRADFALRDQTIVSVTDARGVIVEVNEAFCRVSGYRREELLGARHSIVKSGRHPQAFYDELWRTITAGRIWTGEICNRRKDGGYYWVRSTIVPVLGASGRPEEYVSVRSEITADKQSDERLALLERAILSSSSGIVVADALCAELPIAWASPSFARLLERDEQALQGVSLVELLAAGQSADVYDALDALLHDAEGGTIVLRGARTDGTPRTLDLRVSPMRHSGVTTHVVGIVADATELEETRSALRDREERLQRSQAHAGFGTWDWEIETGRLYWSASIASMFGLGTGEIHTTYDRFFAAVHPYDRQRVTDAVQACLTLDRPYDVEHRCIRPDGSIRWVHETGHVLRDERGRPARMLGVVSDVTDRRALADELQRTQQRLALAQELARLGDWRLSDRGKAWWSTTMYALYQRDPATFHPQSESFVQAADPRDRPLVERALADARDGRESDCLHRVALPNGERRWVRLRARPEFDELGAVVALAGTVQDVNDAVHREDCARLLRRVITMGEDAFAIADRHGELIYANHAWRRILGRDDERRPRGPLLAACAQPERDTLARELQRGDPALHHRGDLPMQRADGTSFVARGEIAVSHDTRGDVQYFVHQFRDAGEALAHERALAEAQVEAARAREAAYRVVADACEALHAPSQAVLAFAHMLSTRPELSAVARQCVRQVLDAGRRILHVVGDELDRARAEAGRLSLRIECVALDALLAALRRPGLDGPALELRVSIACAEPLAARCDPMRVRQALRALLAGAREGSLVATRPSSADGDAPVEFRIVREADAASARERESLARLLLERMGATLARARSEETIETLVVRLPAARPADDTGTTLDDGGTAPVAPPELETASDSGPASDSATASESEPASAPEPVRRTVLHVDGDHTRLSLLQELFRDDARVRILLSPSTLLAVELALAKRPDAAMVDVDSAAVDGFAMIRELKSDPRTRDLPVIALTADVSERNRRCIEGCGFFRFVEKPLSLPELLRTIDAALALRTR